MSEIRVNTFKAEDGISAPSFPNGIQVTGVVTATVLDSTVPFLNAGSNIQLGNAGIITATGANISGNISAVDGSFSGNVSIAKTLTYEDVTNIDSVGLITARSGIKMTGGSLYVGGNSNFTGTLTGTATTSTTITVADESSDTTCFPVFATAATGSIAPKTGSNLSFNSNTGALTATSFSGSGSGITGVPAANLTGTAAAINGSNITNLTAANLTGALPAISGANLTGISTPLVAYKAKELARQRYSFSGSSWHEIETNFRLIHTPAAVGNTIICAVQIYLVIGENTYGGLTIVSNQGSGSDEAMLGETNTSGGVAKGSILGGNYANEQMRQSGGTTWLGQHLWGYHITENTNAHTFKLFGRMGSGTRNVGDNQYAQFMQMWEYQGNVVSSTIL